MIKGYRSDNKDRKSSCKKVNELTRIAIEASAAGMTYGKYVEKQNAQLTRIQRKEKQK